MTQDQQARQLDRDRRVIETAFVLWSLGVFDQAQQHAAQAVRLGVSPSAAAAAVLLGSDAIHQPGWVPLLAGAAVNAWALGRYRSRASDRAVETGRPIGLAAIRDTLARVPDLLAPPPKLATAARGIVDGVGGPDAVQARRAAALDTARPIARAVARRVGDRLDQVRVVGDAAPARPRPTAQTPPAVSDAIDQVRTAFDKTGIGTRTSRYAEGREPPKGEPNVSTNVETIVETTVGMEYDAGREAGAVAVAEPETAVDAPHDLTPDSLPGSLAPAEKTGENDQKPPSTPRTVKPKLWGFRWYTIEDGHECPACRSLDGVTAPVGSPVWVRIRPLCHHGCRCVRLNVYQRPGGQLPLPRPPDYADPNVQDAIRMRQKLMAWWDGLNA